MPLKLKNNINQQQIIWFNYLIIRIIISAIIVLFFPFFTLNINRHNSFFGIVQRSNNFITNKFSY